jgi:hypothetical protein
MLRLSARILALMVAGCSDGVGPRPIQSCSHDQEVAVIVNADPVPVFTWDPPCGLASIAVWDQNRASGWVLFTGSRAADNPLRSGIRYGDAPPEALEPTPADRLTSGTYTVIVYRWSSFDESGAGSLLPVGEATFER